MRRDIDVAALPAFLRELADAVEKGGTGEFGCVEGFRKFKISGRSEFGSISIKAKFKTDAECREPGGMAASEAGEGGRPEYSTLKKRMRTSFNQLVRMIHDGAMPPVGAVESFLADSALMISYPGYGDEYYDEFHRACEEFRAAYASGDMENLGEAIDVLIHEKSRCHAKYD